LGGGRASVRTIKKGSKKRNLVGTTNEKSLRKGTRNRWGEDVGKVQRSDKRHLKSATNRAKKTMTRTEKTETGEKLVRRRGLPE